MLFDKLFQLVSVMAIEKYIVKAYFLLVLNDEIIQIHVKKLKSDSYPNKDKALLIEVPDKPKTISNNIR
jgi:hypothetical protein